MQENQIIQNLKQILMRQNSSLRERALTTDASLAKDLGFDSLDIRDIYRDCEQTFKVEFPFEGGEPLETVHDVVKYIQKHQQES